eukprot:CAMPEP_0179211014 /NCGR_PEP_ID=MMETSP0797-20121207/133_1 /TAXON_ID=47934 /ORGANISM="Dinophysis acuminata, Strain DAEP01" /LENGTH=60 /DNA_ID=CAMNT_0020916105 /DNA_START=39 /DNA_END=218 /DNA_ORIENTATION=-
MSAPSEPNSAARAPQCGLPLRTVAAFVKWAAAWTVQARSDASRNASRACRRHDEYGDGAP